jgi:predicted DNA-binding transcriptional regulator AlpA
MKSEIESSNSENQARAYRDLKNGCTKVRESAAPTPEIWELRIKNKHRAISNKKRQPQSDPGNSTDSEATMTPPLYARALTVRGAAIYLGLSASTLNKLRCTGAGPIYFKLGRAVRYDPQELDQWLAAHRIGSTSQTVAGKMGV